MMVSLQMPALHTTRFNAGATVVADRLFVYGGRGINNSMHCSMEEYLPESQSWVQLEPMSSARASHFHKPAAHYEKIATIQLSNSLLVLGGGDQRSMIQATISSCLPILCAFCMCYPPLQLAFGQSMPKLFVQVLRTCCRVIRTIMLLGRCLTLRPVGRNNAFCLLRETAAGTWQKVERFKPLHGHKIYEALTLESRM